MRNTLGAVLAFASLLLINQGAAAGIIAPGFQVQVYAPVTDPVNLTFDSAGNLFVGRDNVGSGGGNSDAVRIHRVGVGGSPVAEYGDSAIFDPDSVVFDALGTISGTAGSVLVGGGTGSSMTRLTAILPNESISEIFTISTLSDIGSLSFDSSGRLLIRDDHNISAMTDSSVSSLSTVVSFGTIQTFGLAVGTGDQFFCRLG